jgi:hypothetical protein
MKMMTVRSPEELEPEKETPLHFPDPLTSLQPLSTFFEPSR